jgi:flagellar basal body-associated protein FliL
MAKMLKIGSRLLLIAILLLTGVLYKENQKLAKELLDSSFSGQGSSQIEGLQCSVGKYPKLPLIVLNIRGDSQKQNYLRLQLAVELFSGAEEQYITEAPQLYDQFNELLKEKDVSYFSNEGHMSSLKEELLTVADRSLGQNVIKKIFIQEILVQ